MPVVTARLVLVCLALFPSVTLAEGTYQRTKDGKTTIWNNDPKPGEVAGWWGERDDDGYATGFGTLTWYKMGQQTDTGSVVPGSKYVVYARYFGNMIRGKFDGVVNVHSNGKTAHALFVDGRRSTRWSAGPAPSRKVALQPPSRAGEKRAATLAETIRRQR